MYERMRAACRRAQDKQRQTLGGRVRLLAFIISVVLLHWGCALRIPRLPPPTLAITWVRGWMAVVKRWWEGVPRARADGDVCVITFKVQEVL
jgi:hypothetical protein